MGFPPSLSCPLRSRSGWERTVRRMMRRDPRTKSPARPRKPNTSQACYTGFPDMEAEFIVISGPLLGTRFPLGASELRIGRADTAQIRLSEPEAAWDHCVVRLREGRYHIADCHTGA